MVDYLITGCSGYIRSKRIDKGVSTFDDLIVKIPCNSLFNNGLEDAIYSDTIFAPLLCGTNFAPL